MTTNGVSSDRNFTGDAFYMKFAKYLEAQAVPEVSEFSSQDMLRLLMFTSGNHVRTTLKVFERLTDCFRLYQLQKGQEIDKAM